MKRSLTFLSLAVCALSAGLVRAQTPQIEVTLSAWTHDRLYLDYFEARLPEWEARHPDIRFSYDFEVLSDTNGAVLSALAAREPIPDLIGIEQGGFPNFMRDGAVARYFLDLTDLIADDRDAYAEGRLAVYSYDGKVYGLESSLTASVYYYQPAIFEANGLEVPTTWEALVAAGDTLGPQNVSLTVATNDGNWLQSMFTQRGVQIFDAAGTFVLDREENRSGATEVAELIQRGVENGTFLVVLGDDMWSGATIPTAYREGRLAGQVMPDWWASCCLKPAVEEMAGRWRVAPPPVWEGGGYETLVWGGTGWAVSSGSPNAALAKEFLEFMYLGEESQVQKYTRINMFPWMLTAYRDPRIRDLEDPFFSGQKLGQLYGRIAADVPVWYQSPDRAPFITASVDNLPLLFNGSLTPEAFVDTLIRIVEDSIGFGF